MWFCNECNWIGDSDELEPYHIYNYDSYMDTVPLCPKCHTEDVEMFNDYPGDLRWRHPNEC